MHEDLLAKLDPEDPLHLAVACVLLLHEANVITGFNVSPNLARFVAAAESLLQSEQNRPANTDPETPPDDARPSPAKRK